MRNKISWMARFLALVVAFCAAGRAWALTETIDGITWVYTVNDGNSTVTAIPTSTSGAIIIPTALGGYPVTSIGDYAFDYCRGLTSVTIPDSVTSIGNYAFVSCSGLTSVTIPDSVRIIGDHAFAYCKNLKCVTIGEGVERIEDYAFGSCFGNIIFRGNEPEVIGGYSAFKGCKIAYVMQNAIGFEADDSGRWNDLLVRHYNANGNIGVGEKGSVALLDDGYVVTANDGEILADIDFAFPIGLEDAYKADIAADGKSAIVKLKPPELGLPDGESEVSQDASDPAGVLVEVSESEISAKPSAKGGESVGALPVKTYSGLFYQAAWGDDLGNMTSGDKVQATGDSLYLGVIKQTGDKGFYKLSVSER